MTDNFADFVGLLHHSLVKTEVSLSSNIQRLHGHRYHEAGMSSLRTINGIPANQPTFQQYMTSMSKRAPSI